jgi:hypothetical protein
MTTRRNRTQAARTAARQVGEATVLGTRKAWLAMLGTYAVARKAAGQARVSVERTRGRVEKSVVPRYQALVTEGRKVERGLLRTTGEAIERAVAFGRDELTVARTATREAAGAARRALGITRARRPRARADAVESLIRRMDRLEADIREVSAVR